MNIIKFLVWKYITSLRSVSHHKCKKQKTGILKGNFLMNMFADKKSPRRSTNKNNCTISWNQQKLFENKNQKPWCSNSTFEIEVAFWYLNFKKSKKSVAFMTVLDKRKKSNYWLVSFYGTIQNSLISLFFDINFYNPKKMFLPKSKQPYIRTDPLANMLERQSETKLTNKSIQTSAKFKTILC